MIYFARDPRNGTIKIGHSATPSVRIPAVESNVRGPLEVLGVMVGGEPTEQAIHQRLRAHKVEDAHWCEWFHPHAEVLDFIRDNATEWDGTDEEPRVIAIHMKGTAEYAAWVDAAHRDTLIPRVQIFRQALREWAEKRGRKPPPER